MDARKLIVLALVIVLIIVLLGRSAADRGCDCVSERADASFGLGGGDRWLLIMRTTGGIAGYDDAVYLHANGNVVKKTKDTAAKFIKRIPDADKILRWANSVPVVGPVMSGNDLLYHFIELHADGRRIYKKQVGEIPFLLELSWP